MKSFSNRLSTDGRIIGAVAAKDLGDAFKNKAIWSTLLMVLLMMALYKALPVVTSLAHPPQVIVYDAGDSALTIALENSPNVEVSRVSSRRDLERFVAMEGSPALGLIVPAGFDGAGTPRSLDGYVQHWVSAQDAEALQLKVEQELAAQAGLAVQIELAGHQVYPPLNSIGPHTWAALSIILMLTLLGMSVTPQLLIEERHSHTLDALLVSPARSSQIVAGKALAGLVYCLIGAGVLLAFNATLIVQWGLTFLAVVLGSLLAVAVGLLLGITVEVVQALRMWMMAVIVPLFILPPVASFMAMDLPQKVNAIVRWFPSVGVSRLFILSMTDQATLSACAPDMALVVGTTVLLLAVVAWRVSRSDR